MPTCTEGHVTVADDYCDVCGSPVTTPGAQTASSAPTAKPCPACQAPVVGRFCEVCGHDSAAPVEAVAQPVAAVEWTAVVTADRDYHKRVIARGGPDTVEFPELFPERRIRVRDNMLIGRRTASRVLSRGSTWAFNPSTTACRHNTRFCGSETPGRRSPISGRPTEPASTTATICWATARKQRSQIRTAESCERVAQICLSCRRLLSYFRTFVLSCFRTFVFS